MVFSEDDTPLNIDSLTTLEQSQSKIPEYLFHYTNLNALSGIVEERKFRMSKIQYLNDTEEFEYTLNMARRVIKQEITSCNPEEKELLEEISSRISAKRRLNIFVACLTSKENSLSQWRSYADNAHGICIRFDTNHLTDSLENAETNFHFWKCIYSEATQWAILTELIDNTIREFRKLDDSKENLIIRFIKLLIRIAPIFKHPSFNEEEEWRIATSPISNRESNFNYQISENSIRPVKSQMLV